MSCSKNQTDCCFWTNSARVALRIDGVLSGLTSSKSRLLKNMSTHSRFVILRLIDADQNVTQEKSTVLTKIYCMYVNTVANKCMRICWICSLSAIYACIVCMCLHCLCAFIACTILHVLIPMCVPVLSVLASSLVCTSGSIHGVSMCVRVVVVCVCVCRRMRHHASAHVCGHMCMHLCSYLSYSTHWLRPRENLKT